MGRVKDYNTFLRESQLQAHVASKEMTRILSKKVESKARVRSEAEIKASFGDEGGEATENWIFDSEKEGYVGKHSIFSGEIILKEVDNDGDIYRTYEVTTGTNRGLSGKYVWGDTSSGKKYPIFGLPDKKNWSDILGPDEDFLKTFVSTSLRWASNISEIGGVKLIKAGLNGVYEIEYDDSFQFYGNVRIYYSGNDEDPFQNTFYSYEVKDGPNKGAKGKGFQIFSEKQNGAKTGIYFPFSNGNDTQQVIQYPAMERSGLGKTNPIIAANSPGGSGIRLDQLIFFNTSDLSSIKGPASKELFEYLNYDLYSSIKAYDEGTAQKKVESREIGNRIIGRIEKSKLPSAKIYALQKTKTVSYTGNQFPSLDGIETSECYISCYQGQPLILYTVKCDKKDSPSFNNKGIGTYGNRFFVGNFFDPKSGFLQQVRGEWYYDSFGDDIGIIYAYGISDKKEITEISNENLIPVNLPKITPIKTETEKKELERLIQKDDPYGEDLF